MIRPFIPSDIAGLMTVQARCPQAAQWRQEDYLQLAVDNAATLLVAEIDVMNLRAIIGFAVFHRVDNDAELRNLAVDPDWQRQGIARGLLIEGFNLLQTKGVTKVFLEVRASNQPALALYRSTGFKDLSTRRNYYRNPDDDAIVMVRESSR
jgi:[ribosomal protein S18]-alanine N-acetyltransferase